MLNISDETKCITLHYVIIIACNSPDMEHGYVTFFNLACAAKVCINTHIRCMPISILWAEYKALTPPDRRMQELLHPNVGNIRWQHLTIISKCNLDSHIITSKVHSLFHLP